MELEERLAELENALKVAQDELTGWVKANQELNQSAAEERARLQGYGNGYVRVVFHSPPSARVCSIGKSKGNYRVVM